MRPELLAITGIFLAFGLLEFFRTRLFSKPEQTRDDALVEIIGSFVLLVITQPGIILATQLILGNIAPQWQGALANIPLIAAIGLFLVFDDMMQYFCTGCRTASRSSTICTVRTIMRVT